MKVSLFLLSLSVASLAAVKTGAHEHGGDHHANEQKPYEAKLAYAPTPLPDRIVLTWADDPATSQAVTWRTSTAVQSAFAEIDLANENGRDLKGQRIAARTEPHTSDLGEAHYHSVQFRGLLPDTLYVYRVGDGVNWSEWFQFRTASGEAKPFSFVYFGDAQNDLKTHWSRVFREAFRDAPRAAFTLHAGDLINRANRDEEWAEWFGAPGWVNATVPVFVTPGNHEYYNEGAGPENQRVWKTKAGAEIHVVLERSALPKADGVSAGWQVTARADDGRQAELVLSRDELISKVNEGFQDLTGYAAVDVEGKAMDKQPLRDRIADPGVRTLSRHWRPQFTLPEKGAPAGLQETCYFLDYQGVRFISLNSNERQEEQVPWLREVLKSNPQRWTIITFHHPVFSPARGRDNAALRKAWKPIFDEFKVDLVLTGHDHTYARTGDVSGKVGSVNEPSGHEPAYDPAIGTVYVVSVSGPKMYDITNDHFAVRTAEDTQLYQVIQVMGDEIRYEARTAIGRLYDAFVLKKRGAGQPNQLLETLPRERRRTMTTP